MSYIETNMAVVIGVLIIVAILIVRNLGKKEEPEPAPPAQPPREPASPIVNQKQINLEWERTEKRFNCFHSTKHGYSIEWDRELKKYQVFLYGELIKVDWAGDGFQVLLAAKGAAQRHFNGQATCLDDLLEAH